MLGAWLSVVDGVYRSEEERLNWLRYAPIDRLHTTLLELQHAAEPALDKLSAFITAQAEASADRAEMASHPMPASARRQVWREPVHELLPAAANTATYVQIIAIPHDRFAAARLWERRF
jgi:TPP-dependent pyruvate/acetoin dehydrogenase alpha subunit